jgi:hypothetical protein
MYDIIYKPGTAIKVQALSDFIAKWTEAQAPLEKQSWNIGPLILMVRYSFKVQEQEFL